MGLEIEKKYLIAYPNTALLLEKGKVSHIVQTYLENKEGLSERVRARTENGVTVYTHTQKRRIGGIARQEDEEVIGLEEYRKLLCRSDKKCATIEKDRYVIQENGHVYEIDIFPFWKDKAFLEIELTEERQQFVLPSYVTVLQDVSLDKKYTNHALARSLHK